MVSVNMTQGVWIVSCYFELNSDQFHVHLCPVKHISYELWLVLTIVQKSWKNAQSQCAVPKPTQSSHTFTLACMHTRTPTHVILTAIFHETWVSRLPLIRVLVRSFAQPDANQQKYTVGLIFPASSTTREGPSVTWATAFLTPVSDCDVFHD